MAGAAARAQRYPVAGIVAVGSMVALITATVALRSPTRVPAAPRGYVSTSVSVDRPLVATVVIAQQGVGVEAERGDTFVAAVAEDAPTLLVAEDGTGTPVGLAITSGDGGDVIINTTSTAAGLVALSAGVIADPDPVGLMGHTAQTVEFRALQAAIGRAATLNDATVVDALASVVRRLPDGVAAECGRVCARRSGADDQIVVENGTVERLVARAPSGEWCGTVAPATRAASPSARRIGAEAAVGRVPGGRPAAAPDEVVVTAASSTFAAVGPCAGTVDLLNAAADSTDRIGAAIAPVVIDELAPLYRFLRPQATFDASALSALAASAAAAPSRPSQRTLADQVASLDPGRGSWDSSVYLDLVRVRAPRTDGGHPFSLAVPAVAAEPDDEPTTSAAPTTQATTPTTAPATAPAATSTTPAVAPATTSTTRATAPGGRAAVALSVSYPAPAPGRFRATVTVRNVGSTPVPLAGIRWWIEDRSSGAVIAPAAVAPAIAAGDIAVGASVTGAVEVVLPEHLGSYRLVLTAPALGTSGVDL